MLFISTILLCVAAPVALINAAAVPVVRGDVAQQMQARAGGGIGDILKDHVKYVANPPSAEQPIPENENNALRETHRQAHKTIFEVMSGAGAGGKKAGGKKADPEAAEPADKTAA